MTKREQRKSELEREAWRAHVRAFVEERMRRLQHLGIKRVPEGTPLFGSFAEDRKEDSPK